MAGNLCFYQDTGRNVQIIVVPFSVVHKLINTIRQNITVMLQFQQEVKYLCCNISLLITYAVYQGAICRIMTASRIKLMYTQRYDMRVRRCIQSLCIPKNMFQFRYVRNGSNTKYVCISDTARALRRYGWQVQYALHETDMSIRMPLETKHYWSS